MAVTGRTSSFSESRFSELLTAATSPASQAELRRPISGEKYQRILTSGSGASLLPCDATMSRRHTPPRNNPPRSTPSQNPPPLNNACTSVHHLNFNSVVPSINDILQSLRKSNAEVQIQKQNDETSLKRKESQPSLRKSMEEIQKGCALRTSYFASSGQYHESSSPSPSLHHHRFVPSSSRYEATPTNGFDRLEQSMQSIGKEMRSAKEKMQDILSTLRALNKKHDGAPSPSIHHQSFRSASPSVEPALIVQDPVDWREDVDEVSGQKLQETAAHQVFEETPQSIATVDEDESAENQETEVSSNAESTDCVVEEVSVPKVQGIQEFSLEITSKDFPEFTFKPPVLEFQKIHMEKVHKFEIDFLKNEVKLELSLSVKEVQDDTIVFSAMSTEELSYEVKVNCKWGTVQIIDFVIAQFLQVLRQNGAVEERMGVG